MTAQQRADDLAKDCKKLAKELVDIVESEADTIGAHCGTAEDLQRLRYQLARTICLVRGIDVPEL